MMCFGKLGALVKAGAAVSRINLSNSLEALFDGVSAGVGGKAFLNLLFCGVVTSSSVSLDLFFDCVDSNCSSCSFCRVVWLSVVSCAGDDNVSMVIESNILRFFVDWSAF
ncbi:hypothetical protein KCU91_g59, partial [Aureobasidium melanogenum]